MDQQDKKISKLYKETYENVHASEDFKEKMMTMTNKKSKKSKIVKVVCILAAAAVMVTAGTIAVSASRTQYDKIIINGEEKMARYVDYGTGTRMWECEENDTAYSVFIYGDYDKDNSTLYFVDYGEYFLASTDPNQTLNLYAGIDQSSFADIQEMDGEKYLCITDDAGTTRMLFKDEADGVADGVIHEGENVVETYALLPNGAVVNTVKTEHIGFFYTMDRILFGRSQDDFWNDLYNEVDSNKN